MKKYFKFLAVAAIVAAGLVGCSNETPVNPGDDNVKPVISGDATYATFNFVLDNSYPKDTRATSMTDDANSGDPSNATAVNKIRIIIFNSAGRCEVNEIYDNSDAGWKPLTSKTVKVMSGLKRIFVIANETPAMATVLAKTSVIPLDNAATPVVAGTLYSDFLADAISKSDIGGAGSANASDSTYVANTPIFDIKRLMTGAASIPATLPNPHDYPMSNSTQDAACQFTLVGGVGESDSRGAAAGTLAMNSFIINVKRMVAKGIVYYDNGANVLNTTDGTGSLVAGTLKWGVDNVNRSVYIFQQYDGAKVKSPYYTSPATLTGSKKNYYPYFYKDYTRTGNIVAESALSTTSPYYYFTENTRSTAQALKGNLTYASIEAQFVIAANRHYASVEYNSGLFKVTATLATTATTAGTTFYKLIPSREQINVTGFDYTSGSSSITANALFVNKDLAYKTLYLTMKGDLDGYAVGWETDPATLSDPVKKNWPILVEKYDQGKCYYRFNFGSGVSSLTSGDGITHEIERNVQYKAKITAFTKLGVNEAAKLDDDPDLPDASPTFVTATLSVVAWSTKIAEQPV